MNYEQARFNMIEQQIRPWDVLDTQVLSLLAAVRREDFVPLAHKALAFVDMEIPLRPGPQALAKGQLMLAPKVQARLLQDLSIHKHEKVLEIGTGSGYMTALLAHRAQRVISFEIDAQLAATARSNLQRAGVYNADVREGDGSQGLAAEGPFDVMLLSGSVAALPQQLLGQLKVGGRLAAIVGEPPMMRAHFVTRVSESAYQTIEPWDTVAPRLSGFAQPSRFRF